MKTLVLDTETDGFPVYSPKFPGDTSGMSDHPGQPHMLSFAGRLVEHDGDPNKGTVLRKILVYTKPDGWLVDERLEVPDARGVMKKTAFAVNGLSNAILNEKGRPLAELMAELDADYFAHADEIVAFNATFDRKILRIAAMRAWGRDGHPRKDAPKTPWFCPMKTLQPVIQMPPSQAQINNPKAGAFKPPKLIEAYQWAFGKTFEGAHGAEADEQALFELWCHMRANMPELELHRLRDRDA